MQSRCESNHFIKKCFRITVNQFKQHLKINISFICNTQSQLHVKYVCEAADIKHATQVNVISLSFAFCQKHSDPSVFFCTNITGFSSTAPVGMCLCQFESSSCALFCSELSHKRSIMLCRPGCTIPSRGLWEGSPFQHASMSCQHSSSNTGKRSGREPARQQTQTRCDFCLMMR